MVLTVEDPPGIRCPFLWLVSSNAVLFSSGSASDTPEISCDIIPPSLLNGPKYEDFYIRKQVKFKLESVN